MTQPLPPLRERSPFKVPTIIGPEVARVFTEQIIYLKWVPGMRLIEEELCEKFGVSRSPMREAFQMLEAEGLIVRAARRGVRVSPMSQEDLAEVYTCRAALEGLAAQEATLHANDELIEKLATILDNMARAMAAGDIATFFLNNVNFTHEVHLATRNNTFIRMVAGIENQALRYRYLAHLNSLEMLDVCLSGNRTVLAAIIDRKAAIARRNAQRTIVAAQKAIARALSEFDFDDWSARQNATSDPVAVT